MMRNLLIAAALLGLAACSTTTQDQLLIACEGYVDVLPEITKAVKDGKFDQGERDTIRNAKGVLDEACLSDGTPINDAQSINRVVSAAATLLRLEQAND